MKADVGGTTAGYDDLASRISSKLPLQILVVIALSFLLLILAFLSLAIPLQAAVMNLLSIGASYGVLTAIFQYGWLRGLIGLPGAVPIVSYVPLFMFAILFGYRWTTRCSSSARSRSTSMRERTAARRSFPAS
jgi:RND superfamily putative drug exporter